MTEDGTGCPTWDWAAETGAARPVTLVVAACARALLAGGVIATLTISAAASSVDGEAMEIRAWASGESILLISSSSVTVLAKMTA